uniref:Nucleoporin NSP1-like C-terminal domain-containing protein n=1 Tax=Panagrolaimus sp. JU765 TaxID=591449 RepID=A0AC34QJS6_9BILA
MSAQPPTTATTQSTAMTFNELNAMTRRLIDEFEIMNKQFIADARFVNDYDKVLRDNQRKIATANDELTELENEKSRCASETQVINVQLKEIGEIVSVLEKELGIIDMDSTSSDFAKTSDIKRQNLLQTFLAADAQMQQLEEDVTGLVREVEAVSKLTSKDQTGTDTFEDVQQILAAQMEQLVFVDKQSDFLAKKVNEIKSKINV